MHLHPAPLFPCLHPDKTAVSSFSSLLIFIYICDKTPIFRQKRPPVFKFTNIYELPEKKEQKSRRTANSSLLSSRLKRDCSCMNFMTGTGLSGSFFTYRSSAQFLNSSATNCTFVPTITCTEFLPGRITPAIPADLIFASSTLV